MSYYMWVIAEIGRLTRDQNHEKKSGLNYSWDVKICDNPHIVRRLTRDQNHEKKSWLNHSWDVGMVWLRLLVRCKNHTILTLTRNENQSNLDISRGMKTIPSWHLTRDKNHTILTSHEGSKPYHLDICLTDNHMIIIFEFVCLFAFYQ